MNASRYNQSISSWDDFPVHQASEYIRHAATSDRNFYDRYYFNLHPSSDEYFAIFGLGVYPNLGTTDAFLAVTRGDTQRIMRASKPLDDRMDISVGPFRIEIIEPLHKLRVVVELATSRIASGRRLLRFRPRLPPVVVPGTLAGPHRR